MSWEIPESRGEEIANSITHGIGAMLGVAALTMMTVYSALYGDARHVVSSVLFGVGLVVLYTCSALYHAAVSPRVKNVLEILDHSAIYILIAGTYTPFTLVGMGGVWGWSLFGVVWGLAVAGIVMQTCFPGRFRPVMTALYVAMGWLIVIGFKPLYDGIGLRGLMWVGIGGLSYTAGVFFYYRKRFVFSHAVWHMFVLGGSVCHFLGVLFHIVPGPNG